MSDDELVRQYLLGDLPGDETEALEQRLLREDDLFELAEAMEAEVLEDYARGELTSEQQERVAHYLAVSPEGRLRLAVIRGLAALPAERPAASAEGKLLHFWPVSDLERPQVRAAAIAAMLMIAFGAFWLATQHSIPRENITNRIPAIPTLTPPVEPTPSDRMATSTPPPLPPPAATPTPSPVVFIAMLALSSQRSGTEVPSFDISDRTDIVELRLILPEGDQGFSSYRVVLKDAEEAEVARREGLHAGRNSAQLSLRVDADQLPKGSYSLEVQGVTSEGSTENLAFPVFEVYEP
jgi:anti-sigma factor RsiW